VDLADLTGLAWPLLGLTDEHGRDADCLAAWTSPRLRPVRRMHLRYSVAAPVPVAAG
jgi:hypothetical protein